MSAENVGSANFDSSWFPTEILSDALTDIKSGVLCQNPAENPKACDAWRRVTGAALLAFGCLVLAYNAVCIITFSVSVAISVALGFALFILGKHLAKNTLGHLFNTVAASAQAATHVAKAAATADSTSKV